MKPDRSAALEPHSDEVVVPGGSGAPLRNPFAAAAGIGSIAQAMNWQ